MIRLHGYWRSGAAYRVRIALALKNVAYQQVNHDLRTGAQGSADYAALNPARLVPAIEVDGHVLTQSVAILEWLEERFPDPGLLPADITGRAIVRSMVATIASDVHPLRNLRVVRALATDFGADDVATAAWVARWMTAGFAALEPLVARHGGTFARGDHPTLADCLIVPQLYSARRFGVDLSPFPRLVAAGDHAAALPAFAAAHPDAQPDAG